MRATSSGRKRSCPCSARLNSSRVQQARIRPVGAWPAVGSNRCPTSCAIAQARTSAVATWYRSLPPARAGRTRRRWRSLAASAERRPSPVVSLCRRSPLWYGSRTTRISDASADASAPPLHSRGTPMSRVDARDFLLRVPDDRSGRTGQVHQMKDESCGKCVRHRSPRLHSGEMDRS